MNNSTKAMLSHLLTGKPINIKTSYLQFGFSNPAREVSRKIEKPFDMQLNRTLRKFKSKYGIIGYYFDYNLAKSDYSGQKLPTSINFAISNKYDKEDRLDKWWDKHLFWTLEFKNLTSEDLDVDGYKDDDVYKKIHFGASTMVFNNKWLKLDLRGGLNQGYPTFGFGTELFSFFNVDYSYSTREKGTTCIS